MSRKKVCLLRVPAEIEALVQLQKLKNQVARGQLTNEQASEQFQPFEAHLPDCNHHIHLTRREVCRRESQGKAHFLPGWGDDYAQETERPTSVWTDLPRSWRVRQSGFVGVMQLVEA
jgi:hypothetical protein